MHSKVLTLTCWLILYLKYIWTVLKTWSYNFKWLLIISRNVSPLLHSLSSTVLTSCPSYHHWQVWPHQTDSQWVLSDSLDPPKSLRMERWQCHSHHTPGPLLYVGNYLCKRSDRKDWNYTDIVKGLFQLVIFQGRNFLSLYGCSSLHVYMPEKAGLITYKTLVSLVMLI